MQKPSHSEMTAVDNDGLRIMPGFSTDSILMLVIIKEVTAEDNWTKVGTTDVAIGGSSINLDFSCGKVNDTCQRSLDKKLCCWLTIVALSLIIPVAKETEVKKE